MMELSATLGISLQAYEGPLRGIDTHMLPLIFLTLRSNSQTGHYRVLVRREEVSGDWLVFEPFTLQKYWLPHDYLDCQWSGYMLISKDILAKEEYK